MLKAIASTEASSLQIHENTRKKDKQLSRMSHSPIDHGLQLKKDAENLIAFVNNYNSGVVAMDTSENDMGTGDSKHAVETALNANSNEYRSTSLSPIPNSNSRSNSRSSSSSNSSSSSSSNSSSRVTSSSNSSSNSNSSVSSSSNSSSSASSSSNSSSHSTSQASFHDSQFLQIDNSSSFSSSMQAPLTHQLQSIRELAVAWQRGQKHAVFPQATGSGKTNEIVYILNSILDGKYPHKMLFLVPYLNLIDQTIERFNKINNKIRVNVIKKNNGSIEQLIDNSDVVICTIQTACSKNNEDMLPLSKFTIAVIDEAHLSLSVKRSNFIRDNLMQSKSNGSNHCRVLAFTATPIIDGGDRTVFELLGFQPDGKDNPITTFFSQTAIQNGINCPAVCCVVHPKNPLLKRNVNSKSNANIPSLQNNNTDNENNNDNNKNHPRFNKMIVDLVINAEDPVTKRSLRQERTIIYCSNIAHSIALAEEFNKLDINLVDPQGLLRKKYQERAWKHYVAQEKEKFYKNRTNKNFDETILKESWVSVFENTYGQFKIAESIHSKIPTDNRKKMILKFRELNGTLIFVNPHLLSTGYDDPELAKLVFVGESNSETQVIQSAGRVLRNDPCNPNKIAYIFEINWGHKKDARFFHENLRDFNTWLPRFQFPKPKIDQIRSQWIEVNQSGTSISAASSSSSSSSSSNSSNSSSPSSASISSNSLALTNSPFPNTIPNFQFRHQRIEIRGAEPIYAMQWDPWRVENRTLENCMQSIDHAIEKLKEQIKNLKRKYLPSFIGSAKEGVQSLEKARNQNAITPMDLSSDDSDSLINSRSTTDIAMSKNAGSEPNDILEPGYKKMKLVNGSAITNSPKNQVIDSDKLKRKESHYEDKNAKYSNQTYSVMDETEQALYEKVKSASNILKQVKNIISKSIKKKDQNMDLKHDAEEKENSEKEILRNTKIISLEQELEKIISRFEIVNKKITELMLQKNMDSIDTSAGFESKFLDELFAEVGNIENEFLHAVENYKDLTNSDPKSKHNMKIEKWLEEHQIIDVLQLLKTSFMGEKEKQNAYSAFKYLMQKNPAAVYEIDDEGCNALHYCTYLGLIKQMEFLLKTPINVNQINIYGNTPFHCLSPYLVETNLKRANILMLNSFVASTKDILDLTIQNQEGHNPIEYFYVLFFRVVFSMLQEVSKLQNHKSHKAQQAIDQLILIKIAFGIKNEMEKLLADNSLPCNIQDEKLYLLRKKTEILFDMFSSKQNELTCMSPVSLVDISAKKSQHAANPQSPSNGNAMLFSMQAKSILFSSEDPEDEDVNMNTENHLQYRNYDAELCILDKKLALVESLMITPLSATEKLMLIDQDVSVKEQQLLTEDIEMRNALAM